MERSPTCSLGRSLSGLCPLLGRPLVSLREERIQALRCAVPNPVLLLWRPIIRQRQQLHGIRYLHLGLSDR